MTGWKIHEHAYSNPYCALSLKFVDGIGKWCAFDGECYVKCSEKLSEAIMAIITDPKDINALLDAIRSNRGAEFAETVRNECRALWQAERDAA